MRMLLNQSQTGSLEKSQVILRNTCARGVSATSIIMVSTRIKVQNMGMGFMKGFNWIIDYKHKKMYEKKLAAEATPEMSINYMYVPKILNDKLLVVLKRVGMADYNVGDEIISVDGQPVNNSNKCELLEMLIKNKDWKTLDVKTHAAVIK